MGRKKLTFLHFKQAIFCLVIALCMPFGAFGQSNDKNNMVLSKQLAINGAQFANYSYTYSKKAYGLNNLSAIQRNVDTAIYLIKEAITSLDSAILLASDSALLGIEFANAAKKNARSAYRNLISCKKYERREDKQALAENATLLSANAVVDAYHASFYFKDETITKVVPKEARVPKDSMPKQITKLDIDQALFALLDEELIEKEEKNKRDLDKLESKLKTERDSSKKKLLKLEISKLTKEEAAVEKRDMETKEKLGQINSELEKRKKNKSSDSIPEMNAFAKSRPADDWSRQVLPESELPLGLVFQVQIGVYKNPVTAETFKGITPIFSKSTPLGISDRKSTRLNSSHIQKSRMPSSA